MSIVETRIVTEKNELAKYCDDICKLFKECFSAPMNVELWQWAYLDNVFGNPIVTMNFAGDRLVGHYAVIPNNLVNNKNEHLKSALSMTTMVAESHRKNYLFTTLAEKTYFEMKRQNYDLVCGFPNAMSAPGFRKRLNWEIGELDYVALVTRGQLLNSADLKYFLSLHSRYKFDVQNDEKLNWRLSKPDTNYQVIDNVIVKEYADNLDLMYMDEECIQAMDKYRKYNVLLDSSVKDLLEYKVFEYQFGYRKFKDDTSRFAFDKSMIMSDVF